MRSIFMRVRTGSGQILAAAAVVVSAAVGLLTNVVTGQRGWGLVAGIAALILLVCCGAALAWMQQGSPVSQADRFPLAVAGAARELARARANQIGHVDEMPVRWETTKTARDVMPAGLDDDAGAMAQLEGTFQGFALRFTGLQPPRLVIIGAPGAGKTTLVTKLFDDLLSGDGSLGVPVSIPAAEWGAERDIAGWIGARLKVARESAATALRQGVIFPVIEDLDELPPFLRAEGVASINELNRNTPLLVTARTAEYVSMVRASKAAIRNAAAVELRPLKSVDVTGYLTLNTPRGEAGRWQGLFSFLWRQEGDSLAKVLANPLMLWLAREIYGREGADPGELADTSRFGDRESIEYHMLDEFISGEFAGTGGVPSRWARRADRWLSFLAAELDKTRSREIAWWRFPSMAPGGRPVTFAVRGVLLVAAAWCAVGWTVHHLGGTRAATDPARLLRGTLGRHLVPVWTYVRIHVPAKDIDLHAAVSRVSGPLPHSLLLLELLVVPVAMASGALGALAEVVRPGGATGYHVCRTRVRWRGALIAAGFSLAVTSFAGFLLGAVSAKVVALNRTGRPVVSLLHMRASGVLLLVIFLGTLTFVLDPLITERIDITQLPTPGEALRLQRRHTRLLILLGRASRVVLSWLVFGPVIAIGYGCYEIVAVSCRIILGGRRSASDVFDDARLWLACTGRMPWRVMKLLATAARLGVLRPTGSVYQFHHIRLQQRLAMRHLRWSQRIAAAATPLIRWWRAHSRWPGSTWRPSSAAPWTLPIWNVLFAEYSSSARTRAMRVALAPTDGGAYKVGPGVAQHCGGYEGGLPWVQCWIPGRSPSLVAGSVWQAVHAAGAQALRGIGREGSGSPLAAVGFPVGPVVPPDATRVELSGGSLGDGTLVRRDVQENWRWEPAQSFSVSAAFADFSFLPAGLQMGMETTIGWTVSRLQIEDQRYRALPSILAGDLTRAIAELSAQPISSIHWEEQGSDRRDRGLVTYIGPKDGPARATVNLQLSRWRGVTFIKASSFLRIRDVPSWMGARRRNFPDRAQLLSREDLTSYMSAAWLTVAEILPALVVDDPVSASPVRTPTISMTLSVDRGRGAPNLIDIQSLTTPPSLLLADKRQLTYMEVEMHGPIYLSHSDRSAQVMEALEYVKGHRVL